MARRNPHQEQWAQMVADAATSWGHTGRAFHDAQRGVVTFVGLGDVSLDDPEGRIANYVPDEQRNEMARRCHALLERHFVVPAEWQTGDDELDKNIRRHLIAVRKFPNSPRAQAGVARFGRRLGLDGWEARWRWAADEYIRGGIDKKFPTAVVEGVLMWIELGHPDRAAEPANLIRRGWNADDPDRDIASVPDTRLRHHVIATWWRDGRASVAAIVERRPDFGGNTVIESFALAAFAAESGLIDELRDQVERAEQMLTVFEQQLDPHNVDDNHLHRYVVSTMRSWLEAADPTARPAAAEPARPPSATVTAPVPAVATSVSWRGDVAVGTGPNGSVAIDRSGRPVLAPPSLPERPVEPDVVRRGGDHVRLRRSDGTVIELRHDWNEDQLEDADQYEVTWSPDGRFVAVWGEYGPFVVFRPDGSPSGEFHDHWDGPNFGVVFAVATDRMASWAKDGRVAVYDIDRRLVAGVIDLGGWIDGVLIDAGGRLVLTTDDLVAWGAHDVDSGERLGPVRRATHAALHASRPIAVFTDGEQMWIETYGD